MPARKLPAPRWRTPLPPGVAGSYGPIVTSYAYRRLGLILDHWQEIAINRALVHDADGIPLHRLYLISAGRQQGKTGLVRSLIGAALTEPGFAAVLDWRLILGLAHDRTQARVPYEAVLDDLRPIRDRRLHLTRYLGIRSELQGHPRAYHTASREAANAIRTYSVDLAVFDEVRTQKTWETWAALEPTTRARPSPLILAISTAGTDASVVLRGWFDRGVRIIEGAEPANGFGMTWYAPPDGMDPADRRAVLAANPAVAEGRVPYGPVAASIYSLAPNDYLRETLNLWTEGTDEWLPPGVWPRQARPRPDEPVRIVLAADASRSWKRATVAVALVTTDGVWVGVAGELDALREGKGAIAPAQLVALVARLQRDWNAPEVAWTKDGAAAPHLREWSALMRRAVRPVELTARQVRSASQLLRSELIGGRLTHEDDPLLTEQVRAARPSGDVESADWYLSVTESVGDVDAIRAGAFAAWLAIDPEARPPKPSLHLTGKRSRPAS